VLPLLESARAALDAGDLEVALDRLLEAWRTKRAPRLAELIDRVSAELAAARPTLVKKPLASQWAQWIEVADRQVAADFDRLAAVPLPRKWTEAEPLVAHLASWPADPRLARYLAAIVTTNAVYSKYGDNRADQVSGFYHRLMTRLVELRDHRALVALEEERDEHALPYVWWRRNRGEYASRLRAIPVPEPTRQEELILEQLARRYRSDASRAAQSDDLGLTLLAKVHDRPEDLEARAVYGDWLAERGDPRGEFVALQLSARRNPAREALLLKRHGRGWGGPLDGWFDVNRRVFEGGMLAGGGLIPPEDRTSLDDRTLEEPAWRLITSLDLPHRMDPSLLFHPNLARVRRLTLTEVDVPRLLTRSWPFEELILNHWQETLPSPHPLAEAAAFPELKCLGVHDIPHATAKACLSWLPTAPVLGRLERVFLGIYPSNAGPWWEPMSRSPLPELSIGSRTEWLHTFTRDGRGVLGKLRSSLTYRAGMPPSMVDHNMLTMLAALPEEALTEVKIEASTTTRKLSRAKLEAALTRFSRLDRVALPWS